MNSRFQTELIKILTDMKGDTAQLPMMNRRLTAMEKKMDVIEKIIKEPLFRQVMNDAKEYQKDYTQLMGSLKKKYDEDITGIDIIENVIKNKGKKLKNLNIFKTSFLKGLAVATVKYLLLLTSMTAIILYGFYVFFIDYFNLFFAGK